MGGVLVFPHRFLEIRDSLEIFRNKKSKKIIGGCQYFKHSLHAILWRSSQSNGVLRWKSFWLYFLLKAKETPILKVSCWKTSMVPPMFYLRRVFLILSHTTYMFNKIKRFFFILLSETMLLHSTSSKLTEGGLVCCIPWSYDATRAKIEGLIEIDFMASHTIHTSHPV